MKLKNTVSGKIGKVRGKKDKPDELLQAGPDFVAVQVRGPQKNSYPYWITSNTRIIG